MHFVKGATYEADIEIEGLASEFVTRADITGKMIATGWLSPVVTGDGPSFHVKGVWNRPDNDLDLPQGVSNVQQSETVHGRRHHRHHHRRHHSHGDGLSRQEPNDITGE